ncbi:LPXTG cell wall anchor domain-containing protein [Paenibacillus sp. MBLB4367]|uniref:LPXTG cell wall anchor domain-containing protein n=1 Tax=Paenibacillus sp. MBLB4367 TaxID=3384767 RepID=UPI003907F3DC
MTASTLSWFTYGGIVVLLLGIAASFLVMRRQQHHQKDKPMSSVTVKHSILANP